MANDFGTAKSVFILAIVAGCFAILWPNVFYPMITGDYQQKSESLSAGCCDVIFDNDINGIKIMTQLCENILNGQNTNKTIISFTQGQLSKSIIELCKKTVFDKCSLDITELLSRNSALGKDYKHSLELLRTLNSSICLRESFGISLGQIGLPRRIRIWGLNISKHMKPERPAHLHPEMMHPALREKGRAIQQSQKIPPEARAGAIPGMRPTLGGAGHVVPPPKGGGTMGIVMPMYTIGIVIFFLYTMLKLMFKKSGDGRNYEDFSSDADFQRDVFGLNQDYIKKEKAASDIRLVTSAFTGLLQEVNKQISEQIQTKSDDKESIDESKESSDTIIENNSANENEENEPEKENDLTEKTENVEMKTGVKVIGMETTESCERGKWSRPETPRPPTPQNIYIPAVLPDQSKIIVTDSSTETISSSEDNAPVVLSGKVTLSLIGIQDSGDLDFETSIEKQPSHNEGIEDELNEENKKSEKLTSYEEEKNNIDVSADSDSSINHGIKIEQSRMNTNQDSSLVTNG